MHTLMLRVLVFIAYQPYARAPNTYSKMFWKRRGLNSRPPTPQSNAITIRPRCPSGLINQILITNLIFWFFGTTCGIKKNYNYTFLQINLSKFEVSIQNYKEKAKRIGCLTLLNKSSMQPFVPKSLKSFCKTWIQVLDWL